MNSGTLYRRSAFTDNPKGGNPAGVWVGETLPPVDVMQRIASEIGYSETAFVAPTIGKTRMRFEVRQILRHRTVALLLQK